MAEKKEQRQEANEVDLGQAEVQERMDEINEKGYLGSVPDPTPNENYTVAGVTSGAATPETDPELARQTGTRGRFVE